MTPEEIECFCEVKGARVRIESPAGTITYSSKGVQIGRMLFAWPGDPSAPLALQQDVLDKAKKFVIQPKFGAEMAVAMNRQGGSGATRAMGGCHRPTAEKRAWESAAAVVDKANHLAAGMSRKPKSSISSGQKTIPRRAIATR